MKLVRILPVGAHRIGNACLSLQFDHNLDLFDTTYVLTVLDTVRLDNIFKKYGIDTTRFEYVEDQNLMSMYPDIAHWWMSGDYRGSWLRQQAIKMAMIDHLDADVIFVQDADAFCLKPYNCVTDNKINLWCLPNVMQDHAYYQAFENVTGLPRQTNHCFVCDMMPVLKTDWQSLKYLIESKFAGSWIKTLLDQTPWDHVHNVKWFSEYEFLGNWCLSQHDKYNLRPQRRYETRSLEDFTHRDLPDNVDCVVEKNPYGGILPFDYGHNEVLNFDSVWNRFKTFS